MLDLRSIQAPPSLHSTRTSEGTAPARLCCSADLGSGVPTSVTFLPSEGGCAVQLLAAELSFLISAPLLCPASSHDHHITPPLLTDNLQTDSATMPLSIHAIAGTLQGGLHLLIFEQTHTNTCNAPSSPSKNHRQHTRVRDISSTNNSISYTCSVQPVVSSSSGSMNIPGVDFEA